MYWVSQVVVCSACAGCGEQVYGSYGEIFGKGGQSKSVLNGVLSVKAMRQLKDVLPQNARRKRLLQVWQLVELSMQLSL